MKFRNALITLCLVTFFLMVTGCFSTGNNMKSANYHQQDKGKIHAGWVKKGRGYYLRECGQCHPYINPSERTQDEWQQILSHKKNKVSLTKSQFAHLREYILLQSSSGNNNVEIP